MNDPPESRPDSALAADWVTIWQSEWAAAAVDREVQEAWLRLAALAVRDGAAPSPQAPADAAPGSAWPVPPARATAAVDALGARDAASDSLRDTAIASLLDRVAELERRAGGAADPADR